MKVSEMVRLRRMKLAGHCARHPEIMANVDIFWTPTHGKRNRGRPKLNFTDIIKRDTGLKDINEIRRAMEDRDAWKLYL